MRLVIDWTHLETAARAELFDDADVGRVDACSDEAVEVVVCDLLHLKQLLLHGSVDLHVPLAQMLHGDRRAFVRDERDVGTTVLFVPASPAADGKVTKMAAVDLALFGANTNLVKLHNNLVRPNLVVGFTCLHFQTVPLLFCFAIPATHNSNIMNRLSKLLLSIPKSNLTETVKLQDV